MDHHHTRPKKRWWLTYSQNCYLWCQSWHPSFGERPCPNKLTIWKQKGFTGPGHLLMNPLYPWIGSSSSNKEVYYAYSSLREYIYTLSFLSTFPSHITSFNVYYSMFLLPTFKPRDDVSLPSYGMLHNMHLYNMIKCFMCRVIRA